MRLADMELTHSVELEILHDGRKTTLLTSVEGMQNHLSVWLPLYRKK